MAFGSDRDARRLTTDVNQTLHSAGRRLRAADQFDGPGRQRRRPRCRTQPAVRAGAEPGIRSRARRHGSDTDPISTRPNTTFRITGCLGSTRRTPGTVAIAHPAPKHRPTQSNYYGFENGQLPADHRRCRDGEDRARFRQGHHDQRPVRYAHYTRQFDITEPQLFTQASATTPGASGIGADWSRPAPLSSLSSACRATSFTAIRSKPILVNQISMRPRGSAPATSTTPCAPASRSAARPRTRCATRRSVPTARRRCWAPNPDDPGTTPAPSASRTQTTATTQAVYALDTIKLNEQWQVMGGLRYDRFTADYSQATFPNPGHRRHCRADRVQPNQLHAELARRDRLQAAAHHQSLFSMPRTSFDPSAEALGHYRRPRVRCHRSEPELRDRKQIEFLDSRLAVNGALFYTNQENVSEPDPKQPARQHPRRRGRRCGEGRPPAT